MFQGNYKRDKRKVKIEEYKTVGLILLGFVVWVVISSLENL